MLREEAIELLYDIQTDAVYNILSDEKEALEMAIEALERASCIKEKCAYCPHCEHCDVDDETLAIKALEQKAVLDKIKAEIEQLTSRYSISKERGGMGIVEWSDRLIEESDVLQIIDKYKAESEAED